MGTERPCIRTQQNEPEPLEIRKDAKQPLNLLFRCLSDLMGKSVEKVKIRRKELDLSEKIPES